MLIAVVAAAVTAATLAIVAPNGTLPSAGLLPRSQATASSGETASTSQKTIARLPE